MSGQSISLTAAGAAARGRKRKNIRSEQTQPNQPAKAQSAPRAARPAGIPAGWRVIAAKEFADHISSIRFLVLTLILTLAAAAAVYSAAGQLKAVAPNASGVSSLFLYLFFYHPQGSEVPTFVFFIALLAPVLGIAFGFDGVNGERSEGTLPRLVSQPIHRDDVINGKFVAGLAAISVIFVAIIGVVGAIGVLQLGLLPDLEEVLRLVIWVVLAVVYVGLWLAVALLCSVVFRRAATSALVSIAIWLVLTLFASLFVGIVAGFLSPVGDGTSEEQIANVSMQQNLARLSPSQLFTEATRATLDPSVQTFDIGALVQVNNETRALPSILSVQQSLLVVWPQFVGLIALTSGAFAVAYVSFMRQEVRA
ncbi:MAG: type transport system permease protein [Chloroflexota bacterium]|jgi:ABC-2 type transport system permease protein|nr:type transport system permease protein [Chloroflexota bacterium]